MIEQSENLATRLLSEAGMDEGERLTLAYSLTFGREPTSAERQKSLAFLDNARAALGRGKGADVETRAWTGLAQALFASAEFRYIE